MKVCWCKMDKKCCFLFLNDFTFHFITIINEYSENVHFFFLFAFVFLNFCIFCEFLSFSLT